MITGRQCDVISGVGGSQTFVNYNPLTPIIPVVNGPVYFIKNSSVFLHKSWESSAEELLI